MKHGNKMSQIKIRVAQAGDEPAIAKVHIQSWQEAYKGLIPQDYLDQLSSELRNESTCGKES